MATIYSNKNSGKNALAASQHIKNIDNDKSLLFENFQKEMKETIKRDLYCVKKIKW